MKTPKCAECRQPLPAECEHPDLCPECVWSLVKTFGGDHDDEYPDLPDMDNDDWDD